MTRDEILAALIALIDTGIRAVDVGDGAQLAYRPEAFELTADLLYAAVQGEDVMARVRRENAEARKATPAVNAAGIGRA